MCGFTAIFDTTKTLSIDDVRKELYTLDHRGPDSNNYIFDDNSNINFGFIHNRLAILDLSQNGAQPMRSRKSILVFNGEIYNYLELQKKFNLKIKSSSDTEVLQHGLDLFGEEFIHELNGMFSFCYYNFEKKLIIISRDRLGVKPLYLYKSKNKLIFSSEIKGIKGFISKDIKINMKGVFDFFNVGAAKPGFTLFEGIESIKPGQYISYNTDNLQIKKKKDYWEYSPKTSFSIKNKETLLELFEATLIDSIKLRLRSDVPLGVYLSGGYDSSLVSYYAKQHLSDLKTFSIGSKNSNYDESRYAEQIAKKIGSNHKNFILDHHDLDQDFYQKLIQSIDDPIADPSLIPSLLLNRYSSSSIKVALTGDGGDELFAGYSAHRHVFNNWKYYKKIKETPLGLVSKISFSLYQRKFSRIKSYLGAKSPTELYSELSSYFNKEFLENTFFHNLKDKPELNPIIENSNNVNIHQLLKYDIENVLSNRLLSKTDRSSMAYGVEAREPLLDYRLFELATNSPSNLFIDKEEGKLPIKLLAKKYIGEDLLNRPKTGFNIPIKDVCQNFFKENQWIFDKEYLIDQGIFSSTYISEMRKELNSDRANYRHIYTYLIFQLWYKNWFKS